MTRAGGLDMPAEVAGRVAINEIVVHGWDIATATGQPYSCEPELLEAAYEFVQSAVDQNPEGTPGLFGAPVAVPDDAPLLDRLIGLTGRDPAGGRTARRTDGLTASPGTSRASSAPQTRLHLPSAAAAALRPTSQPAVAVAMVAAAPSKFAGTPAIRATRCGGSSTAVPGTRGARKNGAQ